MFEPRSADFSPVRELGALGAVPGGLGVVEGGTIPYTPEALAQRNENFANRLERDPAIKCYLPGHAARHLHAVSVPDHPEPLAHHDHPRVRRRRAHDLHGRSDGISGRHLDGVVQRALGGRDAGGRDEAASTGDTVARFGRGTTHSTALRVVERFTPRSPETLDYHVTLEDPNVYTRSWSMRMPLYRRVGAERGADGVPLRRVRRGSHLRSSSEEGGPVEGADKEKSDANEPRRRRRRRSRVAGYRCRCPGIMPSRRSSTSSSRSTLEGQLVKWEMINPHSWFHIDVEAEDGTVSTWLVEGGSPNELIRQGVNRNTVEVGTFLAVEGLSGQGRHGEGGRSQLHTRERRAAVPRRFGPTAPGASGSSGTGCG